jgi:hypothetical protein
MSARKVGDLLAPILTQAVGLARLHDFLSCFPAAERVKWIAAFKEGGTITPEEADILLECNGVEAA